MDFGIKGKKAIVGGASRGLGVWMCYEPCKRGG